MGSVGLGARSVTLVTGAVRLFCGVGVHGVGDVTVVQLGPVEAEARLHVGPVDDERQADRLLGQYWMWALISSSVRSGRVENVPA